MQLSQACENNKKPIKDALKRYLKNTGLMLEIGCGTGQHAVYFAKHFSGIKWLASDLGDVSSVNTLPGALIYQSGLKNCLPPVTLDVTQSEWPIDAPDYIFTANTLHIMSKHTVTYFFDGVGERLKAGGYCFIYGPFNYQGSYTSPSNQQFDQWLAAQGRECGIRDFEWVVDLAKANRLELQEDIAMPANNRFLVFIKQ